MGRRWHFFFAWILVLNGLVYVAYLIGRRQIRDLWPTLADLKAIPRSIANHVRLRFPEGEDGDKARALLPDVVRKSHDRLCTVSRTVELGTPIADRIES